MAAATCLEDRRVALGVVEIVASELEVVVMVVVGPC